MFRRLGTFATRFRWPIVIGWVVLAVLLTLVAPNINDVSVNDQRAFLPKETPSLDAVALVEEHFPDRFAPSSAVLVIDAGEGRRWDEGAAGDFTRELTTYLEDEQAPDVIDRVVSPVDADEQTADALVSEDGRVALIVVRFTSIGTETVTKEALADLRQRVEAAPEGVETYVTGDAEILAAYDEATRTSIDSTTWITILLVVVILLLVYRSPVSPLIPLVTIGLAYLIARAVVAFLGDGVMTISGYTNIFLIVILFGAGTDYCLFLISRFREEMSDRNDASEAAEETVRTVGETIASSAGTVVVGLSTMALAELGLFNTTGPSIAIGVVIALAAGLTFTPALLCILGNRAFWPRHAGHLGEGRFWTTWARAVTARPVLPLIGTLVVLVPLAIYGAGQTRDFDLLGDLPDDDPAKLGFQLLSRELGPGVMQPLTIVATRPDGFTSPEGLTVMQSLDATLKSDPHVATVRSLTGTLEGSDTLNVAAQLKSNLDGVNEGIVQLTALADQGAEGGLQDLSALQSAQADLLDLFSYLQQLGTEYPAVLQDPGYQQAMEALSWLADIGSSAGAGSIPGAAVGSGLVLAEAAAALQTLASGLEQLQQTFAAEQPDAQMLPQAYLKNDEGLAALDEAYLADGGRWVRYQVVLDVGPYTPEALDSIDELRTLLQDQEVEGAVEGSSAIVADLRSASDRDLVRSVIWVLLGVFVVLVLLLRALVAPIYLILTILLSYMATLGIMRLVFEVLLGEPGVTWWVPIFMFVMLVALGMDYNIFLMGRVKEEVGKSGNRDGIRTAVAKTGGIITSAGIIMAGTFAAMMSAEILGLIQIGFAVAVGVLLDTFVVRTALVPAIAVLLGRWSWWPRRRS